MNALHPLAALTLGVVAVGGRALLDTRVGPDAGEAWQRGIEVLTAATTLLVVFQFSRGDPPRRPWGELGVAMALIPGVRLLSSHGVSVGGVAVAHLVLIFGNILLAASVIGFGRVLGGSELLSERPPADRKRATAIIAVLAIAALATLAFNTVELALRGLPTSAGAGVAALAAVVSTLCDALVFAGGLYLVWLVRPLLGGSLARPYLLIAVGAGAFLVVDMYLVTAGATTQTDLVATGLRTLLPKWLGCLAFTSFALAAATQAALLLSARRRR